MLKSRSDDDIREVLKSIYLPHPTARWVVGAPIRAVLLGIACGFVPLFVGNWLNDSMIWSSSAVYRYRFLCRPFDWLFIGMLLPAGLWAVAHYYRSLFQGIERLIYEGIIQAAYLKRTVSDWKARKGTRLFFWALRCTVPLIFIVFIVKNPTSWVPEGEIAWFMSSDGRLNFLGYLNILLNSVLAVITLNYLLDVIKVIIFHNYLVKGRRKDDNAQKFPHYPSGIGFRPHHPDGSFGYGLLAPPMQWAGIFCLLFLAMMIVTVASDVAVESVAAIGEVAPVNFMPLVNTLAGFIFVPWIVLGPVFAFVRMLVNRKKEYLFSLRALFTESSKPASIDALLKEWDRVAGGHPYILERKSILVAVVLVVVLAQITRLSELALVLARWNVGLLLP